MSKRFANNEELIRGYLNERADEGQTPNGHLYFDGDVLYSYGPHFPLAVRRDRYYIVNADRYSATTSSKHQAPLFRLIPNSQRLELPFSALTAMANLRGYNASASLAKEIDVIDWETDRYLDTGRVSIVTGEKLYDHVMGGSVFRWNGNVYICGMDPTGTGQRGRFFLTQLDKGQMEKYGEPASMDDAYELLKPDIVKKVESQGVPVLRQGEWFFVKDEMIQPSKDSIVKNYQLVHHVDRDPAHSATEGGIVKIMNEEIQVVRGIIRHARKEHRQVKLYEEGSKERCWYRAYESVQGQSWSAGGNVD